MKKVKMHMLFLLVIFIVVGIFKYYFNVPDGSTIVSREEMMKDLPKGNNWTTAIEKSFEDCIISGIYSDKGKSGIAVFSSKKNGKYKLVSREWRENDQIIISSAFVNGDWYDIIWFNGAQTEYAEITYNISGKEQKLIHNSQNMEIFVNPSPDTDYSINVVYYDKEGNIYK